MPKHLSTPLFLLFLVVLGCTSPHHPHRPNIIPEPVSMKMEEGNFQLNQKTVVLADTSDNNVKNITQQLKKRIDSATGFRLKIQNYNSSDDNTITLAIDTDTASYGNKEGYSLTVTTEGVTLQAPTPQGLFYGIQTLFQLLPPQIYQSDYTLVPQDTHWIIPDVKIKDYPRFKYRGMHLDVSRHFFPVTFIKKYIDLMAMDKMNRFHWHLTDDQGWRIQIKKYPKLTSVGAWRDSTLVGHYGSDNHYNHERYGGYYTQDEIREVVQYAQKRYITVIPEIEMPGHASAAIASYPELGCSNVKQHQVRPLWGVFEDIYCPSDHTFTFLENVLTEVMDLFPSKYIHIGGDEAPKTAWKNSPVAQQVIKREGLKNEKELQSYFIRRIEKFLNAHGRDIIGWDEILEGGLAPNATVMSWRGTEGGIEAAKQHHNVIMTPGSYCYLDHYQANPSTEPLAIGGFTSLKKVYSYDPVPDELSEKESQYILGAQANIWTEYIDSGKKVEYMAYPRASALAEVTWSPKSKRNWTGFWRRMQTEFKRFDVLDVNAAQHYRGRMPHFSK